MLSITFIFLLALLATASPLDGLSPQSGLSWTGEVDGHGVVTLYGDANSVQEQIFALEPSLAESHVPTTQFMAKTPPAVNFSELYSTPDGAYYYMYPPGSDNSQIAARDDVNGAMRLSDTFGPSDWYCGTFATGDSHELNDVVAKVGSPGGKDPRYALWSIAGAADGRPTCQRLACAVVNGKPGSTAVYVSKAPRFLPGEPVSVVDVTPEAHDLVPWCNDNEFSVTTMAENLAAVAASIANGHEDFNFAGCCKKSQQIGSHNQFSGQLHMGNGTNINIGYGDCSRPDYFSNPGNFGYPGPLGSCI